MQYYLDTNILAFLFSEVEKLDRNVLDIVSDYSNRLYISSVGVMEMIQILLRRYDRKKRKIKPECVFDILSEHNIEIKCTTIEHLKKLAVIPELHSDPNDRLIIAQAASDRIPLISSDLKFKSYVSKVNNFEFVLNHKIG